MCAFCVYIYRTRAVYIEGRKKRTVDNEQNTSTYLIDFFILFYFDIINILYFVVDVFLCVAYIRSFTIFFGDMVQILKILCFSTMYMDSKGYVLISTLM